MKEYDLTKVPPKEKTACFTGHRVKRFGTYDEQHKLIILTKDLLRGAIEELHHQGYENFIAGGAIGVDTWAAEAVLDLKERYPVRLYIARPFRGQEAIWPEHSRRRYNKILLHADGVYTVCDDDVYEPWKMHKRNRWMVDSSSYVIAVYDGSSKGGTYECVKYATQKKKSITIINPFEEQCVCALKWHT